MLDKTDTESRIWDREEVKIRIKQLYRLGRDISSWRRAVEQAGFDYDKIKKDPGPAKGYKRKKHRESQIRGYIDVCRA